MEKRTKILNTRVQNLVNPKFADNAYYVLKIDGIWVSALRLYQIEPSLYYLKALETHPQHRTMGYASRLLNSGTLAWQSVPGENARAFGYCHSNTWR